MISRHLEPWIRRVRRGGGHLRVEKGLLDRLRAGPGAQFSLILRVSGSLTDATTYLIGHGIPVRRTLALTHSLSFSATGAQALQLMRQRWADALEEDKPVRTLH
jgi:hypothetical protein